MCMLRRCSIETEYRKEVESLVTRCHVNNLSLNICKMKELVIDFRTYGGVHLPFKINSCAIEMVESSKFLET